MTSVKLHEMNRVQSRRNESRGLVHFRLLLQTLHGSGEAESSRVKPSTRFGQCARSPTVRANKFRFVSLNAFNNTVFS
jgi:hypothetical protein